jgi:hypothetical protein
LLEVVLREGEERCRTMGRGAMTSGNLILGPDIGNGVARSSSYVAHEDRPHC